MPLRKYVPHLVIFASSACVMVMEIVAGRLVARYLGASIYTWTSIISVVLAGIALGNALGGRLADRWAPASVLGWLFMVSSALCLVSLGLNSLVPSLEMLKGLSWPLRTFLTVMAVFTLPAMALGTISPVTAKMALLESKGVGRTVGSLYAWGAAGSILGTLAAGFWLVAWLGSQGVVLAVAFCLALVGAFLGPQRVVQGVWALLLLGAEVVWQVPDLAQKFRVAESEEAHFARDSKYQFVKVTDYTSSSDPSRALRMLTLDYLIHGYVCLEDPEHLEYDYERLYAELARMFVRNRVVRSAFFIGGGSYTFPRWVVHQWPGISVDVAEIDPMVLEAAQEALGLDPAAPIRTLIGDARNVLDDLDPGRRFDLIFGDAFSDLSIPWHLTTREFALKVKRHLETGGAYLLNVIDDYSSGLFLGSCVETLRLVFRNVYVFTTEKVGVREERETYVVAASDAAIDVGSLGPGHATSFPGSVLTEENLRALSAKCGSRVLTDDDAPVENLLAPVIRRRKD